MVRGDYDIDAGASDRYCRQEKTLRSKRNMPIDHPTTDNALLLIVDIQGRLARFDARIGGS